MCIFSFCVEPSTSFPHIDTPTPRFLLKFLFLYQAFNYIDSEGEHIISKETFTKESTKEVLDYWLGPSEDWEEDFDNIDLTNKKGEGNVLFRVKTRPSISLAALSH